MCSKVQMRNIYYNISILCYKEIIYAEGRKTNIGAGVITTASTTFRAAVLNIGIKYKVQSIFLSCNNVSNY